TYGAVIATIAFIRYLPRVNNYYFLLVDAVGMALFNIMGIEKALINGSGMVVAITMGITTGIFGGLIRDVICREVPTVMRSEPYASACLAGGAVYA
ncbi:TRIC cation channel family protein, partial [Pseudoalteromonas sp. 19-MNA-CIBAN-0066]